MTSLKITNQQRTILTLLYQYRFLNRHQIQTFLNHKDHRRINSWLKDLNDTQLVNRIYSTNFGENTKPAIYSIGSAGIKVLKETTNVPASQIRKLYRESERSRDFIDRCLMLAEVAIALQKAQSVQGGEQAVSYTFETATDVASEASPLHFMTDISPQLIIKKDAGADAPEYSIIEILSSTMPNYAVRRRIKDLLALYSDGDWIHNLTVPLPRLLIVCPTKDMLAYVKRHIKKLKASDDAPDLNIHLTLRSKLQASGVTGDIWDQVWELQTEESLT